MISTGDPKPGRPNQPLEPRDEYDQSIASSGSTVFALSHFLDCSNRSVYIPMSIQGEIFLGAGPMSF
jgi:hypothetical protein